MSSTNAEPTGLAGTWDLNITSPLGPQTATLIVDGAGDALTGKLSSSWGEAPVDSLTLNGDTFNAALALKIQGMAIQATISGRREGDDLSGTIKTNMPIVPPLMFTGKRVS